MRAAFRDLAMVTYRLYVDAEVPRSSVSALGAPQGVGGQLPRTGHHRSHSPGAAVARLISPGINRCGKAGPMYPQQPQVRRRTPPCWRCGIEEH